MTYSKPGKLILRTYDRALFYIIAFRKYELSKLVKKSNLIPNKMLFVKSERNRSIKTGKEKVDLSCLMYIHPINRCKEI